MVSSAACPGRTLETAAVDRSFLDYPVESELHDELSRNIGAFRDLLRRAVRRAWDLEDVQRLARSASVEEERGSAVEATRGL